MYRRNFSLYEDKGIKFKDDLENIGFTNIKMWEQPINIMFKSGEDYYNKFAKNRIMDEGVNMYGMDC